MGEEDEFQKKIKKNTVAWLKQASYDRLDYIHHQLHQSYIYSLLRFLFYLFIITGFELKANNQWFLF